MARRSNRNDDRNDNRNDNRNDHRNDGRPRRPGFVVGLGGNVEGYGRGGALDYGYGGMNVAGRDVDWGIGDVPHRGASLGNSRLHDEEIQDERDPHWQPNRQVMRGGGYGGVQARGGQGYAVEPDGEIQGGSYGRAWRDAGQMHDMNELAPHGRNNAGRRPRGYRRSDVRISEDVCDAMTDDAVLDPSDVDVRVEGCEVTLSGTVESRAMKRRAEDIAASVRGVVDVHNRLRIGREDDARDRESERVDSRGDREERAD